MKMDAQAMPKKRSFKYLESIIPKDGEIEMMLHIILEQGG